MNIQLNIFLMIMKKVLWCTNVYELELKLNKIYLINEIFFAAIRENKLSTDILLSFLIGIPGLAKIFLKNWQIRQ